MYTIQNLDVKRLADAKVKHQEKIIKLTGSKFIPIKAYEILKTATGDFSTENDKAREVDELFSQFLQREGIKIEQPKKGSIQLIRIRERERARAIELLELGLELEHELALSKK